ncbi:MAG TPA: hypothetical protein PKA90_10655 [Ignavibacteria bacterium]|nr:hypothetical protein [Ignavibacteria bacterium]HMR40877.1 hypothetical protein [Ignavibacteria bacterium]
MTPINLKLINLLNSFTPNEIKEFKKFISSGLYTSGRNYLPLLNFILKNKSKYKNKIPNEELQLKLNSGKKFSKQTLKNRFSELYKLGEEFLIYLAIKDNKLEKDKLLLKMLIEKNLLPPFESKYNKIIQSVEKEKYYDKKFEAIVSLHEQKILFLHEKRKENELYDLYHDNSQLRLCIYLISLFEIGFEYGLQEYSNREYDTNYLMDFLRNLNIDVLINKFILTNNVIYEVTAMNYYLFKAFESSDMEEYYFKSHKIFSKLSHQLSEIYRTLKFNQMIHYSIKKQNEGIKKFQFELFKLYNEKLDQGLFSDLQNKMYLANNFRDYVYIGIAIKKYKWVEDFLKKYSKELPEEFREDELKLSYAKLYIANKDYEKSLLSLENIKADNYLSYTDSSVLKLCCYYELGLFEDAFLELDKLKHYLRNHKEIPKVHSLVHNNFIQVYQKLLRCITKADKKDIGYLKKEYIENIQVTKSEWLLEKIEEINKC